MLKIAIESDRFTYPTADSLFEISLHLICLFMELSKSWITSSVTWTRSLMKYLVVNSHMLSVLNTGKLEDVKVNCTLLSALYSSHTQTLLQLVFVKRKAEKQKPKWKCKRNKSFTNWAPNLMDCIWFWLGFRKANIIYINNSYLCIPLMYESVCVGWPRNADIRWGYRGGSGRGGG